jgi:hypothetical protein
MTDPIEEETRRLEGDEIHRAILKDSLKNTAAAEASKRGQTQQSLNDAGDREETARFGLTKAYGGAFMTVTAISFSFIPRSGQQQMQPIIDGIKNIFSALTAIRESQRGLRLAQKQIRRLEESSDEKPADQAPRQETEEERSVKPVRRQRRMTLGNGTT